MKIGFITSNSQLGGAIQDIVTKAALDAGHDIFVPDEDEKLDERSAFDLFKNQLDTIDMVIADVSDLSPNSSLLIGAALQLSKPFITIARSGSDAPSSILQSGPYLTYEPSDRIGDIESRLTEWIRKLSADIAEPDGATRIPFVRKHKLFISYSHKDRAYLDRLLIHLRPLERAGKASGSHLHY